MSNRIHARFILMACVGASLLLSACQPAAAVTQVAVANTAVANTAAPNTAVPTLAPPTAVPATAVPATATTAPSATATTKPTDTATATTPPTVTASPTVAPTATAVPATATKIKPTRPAATRVPVTQAAATQAPAATKAPVASGSAPLYSTASGGPQGYTSLLGCTQAGGAACESVMAPGDKAFSIRLEAGDDAVPAIFVPFGLSVEMNGANVADAYMTVVSGWLNPNEYALLGTSHNFSQPGHYVIRTNGCYVTMETYPHCNWGTVNGTIVTFDIQ